MFEVTYRACLDNVVDWISYVEASDVQGWANDYAFLSAGEVVALVPRELVLQVRRESVRQPASASPNPWMAEYSSRLAGEDGMACEWWNALHDTQRAAHAQCGPTDAADDWWRSISPDARVAFWKEHVL